MAQVIKTTFQLRRGLASVWAKNNPVLAVGEPGFEKDTFKLKIGDGILAWNDLPYIVDDNDNDVQIEADEKSIIVEGELLQLFGFEAAEVGAVPYKGEDGKLLWKVPTELHDLEVIKEKVESLSTAFEVLKADLNKFDVVSVFDDTLVKYRDQEIRILFSENTKWFLQNSGEGSKANLYYFGLKVYAPNESIFGFKEDFHPLEEQEISKFENNDFAGIDESGRKYSIIWLPAAVYNEDTQEWFYYGSTSSNEHFVGWDYFVEWYDKNDKLVSSDSVRINLTNASCHDYIQDYYVGNLQTKTDSISISRLVADENTIIVLDGGSAADIIL